LAPRFNGPVTSISGCRFCACTGGESRDRSAWALLWAGPSLFERWWCGLL